MTDEAAISPLQFARMPLPNDHLERVETWGMNRAVLAYVYRPSTLKALREVFQTAKQHGLQIALRGGGRSYGDAALLAENICLDLTRFNRILDWDAQSGIVAVEPGVTLRQLWQYCIADGWWPPVVSGTMYVTIGGAAAMNYHGKNNFQAGPIGDHILEFDLMLPSGEVLTCNQSAHPEIFYAAIGGLGMLGCFTRIVLQMKKVYSGMLKVHAISVRDLEHLFEVFETHLHDSDYLVGWVDCFAGGKALGRGLVHQANYLQAGEDPIPAQTLRAENQELPDSLFGVIPKSIVWRFMRPFSNNLGMRLINAAKFHHARLLHHGKTHTQSHAGFAFLLDYVPNWKFVYKPDGLIQFQSFVPQETAESCFRSQLERCKQRGIVSYLGVFKRHKRDAFLLSHAVDGYSLALDFPITRWNKERLWSLTKELSELVVQAGGRFYFAKDSVVTPEVARAYLGDVAIQKFAEIKHRCDPDNLLQTELTKRVFGSVFAGGRDAG